jgi:glycosyltransferase involved in cell wall biosynthesis
MTDLAAWDIAVIVPCHNEEAAVATVVTDLRAALPSARIYVYDNNSTDETAARAQAAGALVRRETRKGKGNVLRRAFADLDADIYLIIDGDDTYDAAAAPELVRTLIEGPYDHVVGVRTQTSETAYRPGHAFGNRMLTGTAGMLFGRHITDMLSGYRAFSRRYVKSFPASSREFEIETEMTLHSLHLRVPVAERPVGFKDRPAGSESKLRTYRDGWRILSWILTMTRHEKPMLFHGVIAGVLAVTALVLGIPVVVEFLDTGLVRRFPTAFLASSIVILAAVAYVLGYLLESIRRSREEAARLAYLALPAPQPLETRRGSVNGPEGNRPA